MKSIFKKGKQESNDSQRKKIMITDLCPSQKQKIGQMMRLMQRQRQDIEMLSKQLKQQKQNRIIENEKLQEYINQNIKLTDRIKDIEDKYIECCRNLDQQKEKVTLMMRSPLKTIGTQTNQNKRIQTQMQTDSINIQMQQLEQTVMKIMKIDDLEHKQKNQYKQQEDQQQIQIAPQKSYSPPALRKSNNYYRYPPDIPLPRKNQRSESSNEKGQKSASKLAKEWIKVKKQKIKKMKKDILKSEKKMYKDLAYTPQNTENNEDEGESYVDSQSSDNKAQTIMEQYLSKARNNLKFQTKDSHCRFVRTQQNHHPNITIHNPYQSTKIRQSRSNQKSMGSKYKGNISISRQNKMDLDEQALNVMLKSKVFKANDVLQNLKGVENGTKKHQNRFKQMYNADLIDLIETLDN